MPNRDSSVLRLLNVLRSKIRKPYEFSAIYTDIKGTEKHCYIHPQTIATHFELNRHDKSYIRPVCHGCVDTDMVLTNEQLNNLGD